jgi:hypothetical protein
MAFTLIFRSKIFLIVYSALVELADYHNFRLKPNVLFILPNA